MIIFRTKTIRVSQRTARETETLPGPSEGGDAILGTGYTDDERAKKLNRR